MWEQITSGHMSELDAYCINGDGGEPYAIWNMDGSKCIIMAEPFHAWVKRFMGALMEMLIEAKMVAKVEIRMENNMMIATTDTWKEK